MSLDSLLDRLGIANKKPHYDTSQIWVSLEKELKTKLPHDYKDFVNICGGCIICGMIRIYNPILSSNKYDLAWMYNVRDMYLSMREHFPDKLNIALFPEPNGLLPFGKTENGGAHLFWKTEGIPESWQIVIANADTLSLNYFDMSMSDVLIKIVSGELSADVLNYENVDCMPPFISTIN